MKYKIPDGKEYELNCNKNMYLIYGKNGTGKTTLANTLTHEKYKKIVFGSDFIRKNIYISDEAEEKTTNKNSENLTDFLMVDENAIKIKKKIEKLQKIKKDTKKYEFSNEYKETLLALYDEDIIAEIDTELNEKTIISIGFFTEHIKNYKQNCCIKSEDEFQKNLSVIKNNLIIRTFIKELDELGIHDFISEIKEINTMLKDYNESIIRLKKLKNYKMDSPEIEKWKKEGLKIHSNAANCHFCKAKLSDDYQTMKEFYENQILQELSVLEKYLNEKKIALDKVLNNSLYQEEEAGVKKEIKVLTKLNSQLIVLLDKVEKTSSIEKKDLLEEVKIDLTKRDVLTIRNELIKYITINQLQEYLSPEIKLCNINKQISYYKEKLDTVYSTTIEKDVKNINKSIKELGLNEEIELKINNIASKKKIALYIKGEKTIGDVSEGEKHKIALAVFMAKLEKINLENTIVIFDDPVITLDVQTYFRFREYILNLVNTKLCKTNAKLIILSHNIHYLYIQASNLTHNDHYISFYKMYDGGILKNQDIEFLKMDDYSYINYVVSKVKNEEEYVLLFPMVKKMFRHSIDLVSRMNGVPLSKTEIQELLEELCKKSILSTEEKKSIQEVSNQISSVRSSTDKLIIQVSEMSNCILEFNRSMSILKIPFSINVEPAKVNKFDSQKRINLFEDFNHDDICFDMLCKLSKMILVNESSGEANYLAHPNNQVTNSLVAFDF